MSKKKKKKNKRELQRMIRKIQKHPTLVFVKIALILLATIYTVSDNEASVYKTYVSDSIICSLSLPTE